MSCAIGEAVLNVIEDEGLQENAEIVGSYLIEELFKLQSKYTFIGHIRGQGLFIGIELISNTGTLKPNKTLAAKIVNQMKENGILLSTDGPDHNVMKIKPPMVFNEKNALSLVEKLDGILLKS